MRFLLMFGLMLLPSGLPAKTLQHGNIISRGGQRVRRAFIAENRLLCAVRAIRSSKYCVNGCEPKSYRTASGWSGGIRCLHKDWLVATPGRLERPTS
jgi:hypothetical protein